jgi:hypothetical protein
MNSSNWLCPTCHRPFKHKNQAHSCVTLDASVHLDDKSPNVRKIYDKLWSEVRKFGDLNVSVTKSSIMFVSKSTFVAVKPKRNWLDVEFLLDKEVNKFPIHKTFRANKSRVAHFVRLESAKDVSAKLIRWLKASYKFTSEAK